MPGEQEGKGIRVGLLVVAVLNMALCTVVVELVNNVVDQPYLVSSIMRVSS
jgi:hypothetical protein